MHRAIPTSEGFVHFRGYRVWYRIIGKLNPNEEDVIPLLVLHGGPGVPHESVQPLERLAQPKRPIVFYDQLGCGNSDRPDDLHIFTLSLFLEELATIRHQLQLHQIHLFGHSWGGMLALEHALGSPTSLKSLILASTPANVPEMFAAQQRLWSHFPAEIQALLHTGNEADWQQACDYFEHHHYCRCNPWPAFLLRARSPEKRNVQLNRYLWNPSIIPGSGSLATWNSVPRLPTISLPTLITAGLYDGMAVAQDTILEQGIGGSQRIPLSPCRRDRCIPFHHPSVPQLRYNTSFLSR